MTAQEEYIEHVGLFYEQYGLPKMAGRILGYLISSNSDNNSFDDLKDALKASKGSISGNINLLLNQNMIEKHMIAGDRKSYYKMSINNLENILEAKAKSISQFKNILAQGLAFGLDDNSLKKQNLNEILHYYEFLEEEMPLLKIKWEQKNIKR